MTLNFKEWLIENSGDNSGFLDTRGNWIARLPGKTHMDTTSTPEFMQRMGLAKPPTADEVFGMGLVRIGYMGTTLIVDGKRLTDAQLRAIQKMLANPSFTKVYVDMWDIGEYEFPAQEFRFFSTASEAISKMR